MLAKEGQSPRPSAQRVNLLSHPTTTFIIITTPDELQYTNNPSVFDTTYKIITPILFSHLFS